MQTLFNMNQENLELRKKADEELERVEKFQEMKEK
jgi:hypothetical protein